MIDLKECSYIDKCKKYKNRECPIINKDIPNFCLRLFKIDQLQDLALLSSNQRKHIDLRVDSDKSDLEAFTRLKEIESNIENWVLEGNNLYIWSKNTGCGKSSWALRLENDYIYNIWHKSDLRCRCLFISVPKFLISLKDNISQRSDYISHIKENVLDADLVVWDDIATKGFTEFEMENLLNIIDNRISSGKSNIYTSNLFGDDLRDSVGDRLYSRVIRSSEVIEFKGVDKRGLK